VTTFFGILEPPTGRFVYANAGHPPGFLISTQRAKISIEQLRPTGMALGVSEAAQWRQKIARLGPGDYLVLYTDGITETQNRQGVFFGEERLMNVVLSRIGRSAREVQDALVEEVNKFEGYIPQQDDIALIVIRRNKV
jgi:sigma-B regulation protein RsbU (phosphoserine phosphatase)